MVVRSVLVGRSIHTSSDLRNATDMPLHNSSGRLQWQAPHGIVPCEIWMGVMEGGERGVLSGDGGRPGVRKQMYILVLSTYTPLEYDISAKTWVR